MRATEVSSRRVRRRTSLVLVTGALAALAAPAAGAGAQEPGVVYEPGTPSAKEYAIPLEEARTDAGGAIPGSAETRAFGIGLSRAGRARGRPAPRAPGSASKGSRRGADETDGAGARAGAASGAEARSLRERLADAEAVDAPVLWQSVPLLLVLLPGLLVGLLLARRGSGRAAT